MSPPADRGRDGFPADRDLILGTVMHRVVTSPTQVIDVDGGRTGVAVVAS
jgi:hypothetical protein